MGSLSRLFVLLLIAILAVSSLTILESATAQSIPKPAVPEFSLKLESYVKDFEPVYKIDPYTGENVLISEGYQRTIQYIKLSIKRQNFSPYQDSEGNTINLYYNIRVKGHFENDWTTLDRVNPSQEFIGKYHVWLDSEFTYISYDLGVRGHYQIFKSVTPDGKLDFQVEALIGHYTTVYRFLYPIGEEFHGETSGWSNTQTISIPNPHSPPPTLNPSPTNTPTLPPDSSPTPFNSSTNTLQSDSTQLSIIAITVAVLAAVIVSLLLYIKRLKSR